MNNFKLAEHEFSCVADIEVKANISKYRALVNDTRIIGIERDINHWRKLGYNEFSYFLDRIYTATSKKELKRIAKRNSIKIVENDTAIVIIPFTSEAACYYGYNTKWCVSTSKSKSLFNSYFNVNTSGIVVMLIVKNSNKKFVTVYNPKRLDKEYYDVLDARVEYSHIEQEAGITLAELNDAVVNNMVRINKAKIIGCFDSLSIEK